VTVAYEIIPQLENQDKILYIQVDSLVLWCRQTTTLSAFVKFCDYWNILFFLFLNSKASLTSLSLSFSHTSNWITTNSWFTEYKIPAIHLRVTT
jgi:hypothetical protein